MVVIVAIIVVILVVAIALVPMVFAITVVVLSKVSMMNVVVRSSSVMTAAITSAIAAVSMTAITSAITAVSMTAIGPTPMAMVTMLLVPMPLMFMLGMVVPKPQQGVELLVELVVVFVVGVDLVQMLAKFLTKSDDGWAVRAIGKLASGWSCGVFDLQGEILLAPALQKSSHQVIEALRVMHTHAMSLLFLLWLFVLVARILFLVRASLP